MQVKHKRMKRPWVTKEKEGRNFCFNHWWGNKWGNNKDIQERLKKWCRGRQTMAEKWQKQLEKTTQCKSIDLLSLFLAICYFTSYVLLLSSRSVEEDFPYDDPRHSLQLLQTKESRCMRRVITFFIENNKKALYVVLDTLSLLILLTFVPSFFSCTSTMTILS